MSKATSMGYNGYISNAKKSVLQWQHHAISLAGATDDVTQCNSIQSNSGQINDTEETKSIFVTTWSHFSSLELANWVQLLV